jgi:hypothetical protein
MSQINACRSGAFPSMIEEMDKQDEATHVKANVTEEEVQGKSSAFDEEGDRILMMMVHPVDPQHFICASSTVSGRLAEASVKNSTPKGFKDIVPKALHSYEDVFNEMAFDTLPKC